MDSMRSDLNLRFTLDSISVRLLSFMCGIFEKTIPAHSHGNNCYEIHYIPCGYGKVKANGIGYDITPNTLYITGPHVIHEQSPCLPNPMQEYCIYLKIEKAPKKGASSSILDIFTANPFWIGQDQQGLSGVFENLLTEVKNKDTGFQEQIKNLFSQLLIYVIRNYEKPKNTDKPTVNASLADKKSMIIEDYFLYEYRNLSLKTLAANLCLSTRQTQRLLQLYYGKSFQEKKMEARMSNAAVLLEDQTQSITSIADFLGYSSPEQFSTAFRNYYDISPSKFRRQL